MIKQKNGKHAAKSIRLRSVIGGRPICEMQAAIDAAYQKIKPSKHPWDRRLLTR